MGLAPEGASPLTAGDGRSARGECAAGGPQARPGLCEELPSLFELALKAGRLGVWEWDVVGSRLRWDGRMCGIYGLSPSLAPGGVEAWQALVGPEDRERFGAEWAAALAGEKEYDTWFRAVRPDGAVLHVKADGQVVRDSDGRALGMVGLNRDVTDEQSAALARREAETVFDMFLEKSPIYVFFKDENIRAVRLSRNYENLLGRPLSELLGKNMDDLFPSDLAKAMVADDQRVLREGRPIEVYEDFGGRRYQTLKFPVVPAGAPAFLAGYTIDVTDRVRAEDEVRALNEGLERRVLERTAELEEANRELEAFAHTVSHDLRAPARHLDGFLGLLEEDLGSRLDGPAAHDIATARAAARRMGRLVDALLGFARTRRTNLVKGTVEVGEAVAEVVDELRTWDTARNVEWRIGELPAVRADPVLLRVVLFNLVSNAVKFTGKTDRPVVEIGPVSEPDGQAGFFVRDNGAGFDPAYSGKLFGVFQRLHRESEFEGLGIGLATVHRIVARHGGRIRADSSLGAGATFSVTFPPGG